MKLSHLGHACVLVETDTARLLVDPGVLSRFEDVRDLDAVLVTHQHADHVDPARLGPLLDANPGALLVVDQGSADVLGDFRDRFQVAGPGEELSVAGTAVSVFGEVHAPIWGGVPDCANSAYVLEQGAFVHPGDSFFVPPFDVDVLGLPVDAPWLKLGEAIDYVREVRPRVAVPIHEGETTDFDKCIGMIRFIGSVDTLRPLEPGEATEV